MNSERIEEIQKNTAYPESVSVKQALLQVWNEVAQEITPKTENSKGQVERVVTLPESLTAENGAKGLLSGEFFETLEIDCPSCKEHGFSVECEICCGDETILQKVPISWTTIKEIYQKIVKEMAR